MVEAESSPHTTHSVFINATAVESSVGLKVSNIPEGTVVRTDVQARQAAVSFGSEYEGQFNVTGSYSYVYWSQREDPLGQNRTKEIIISNSTSLNHVRNYAGKLWWVDDISATASPPPLRNTINIVGSGSA